MRIVYVLLLFITCSVLKSQNSIDKTAAWQAIESRASEYTDLSDQIWDYAELGYKEVKSSQALQDLLREAGFEIEVGVAGIPTAFIATYGEGYPTIGILAEYDALPGLSQKASPQPEKRENTNNGHGCGHHLFGVASSAAAIAIKEQLQASGKSGTVKLFGCPAEEGGSGKVYLVREGLFDDVDLALHWHPDDANGASPYSSLANISAKFRFNGVSAHAAGAPWNGRSALDGVESMNYMINMMREHIPTDARIHYVITRGGDAPNVVPNNAEVYYYVRHPEAYEAQALFERIVKAAEGAALGTGTEMEYEIIGGVYNILPAPALSKVMYDNLSLIGGVPYSQDDIVFAEKLRRSFIFSKLPSIESAQEIAPWKLGGRSGGSTDVGDISWVVPTAGARIATWVPGTPAHSWQAVACGKTNIAHKGLLLAAKTIAATALDLYQSPAQIKAIRQEWEEARGEDFEYGALIGDRAPALDYRD